ncbi:MAG TPA: MXAN_2562 family outer membrane beta-barrel protein [Polyangiaceae bacterium]|nr:MXAN_2562 family outer membrane beta-barrel protein [Polyangiaceae bacterium]
MTAARACAVAFPVLVFVALTSLESTARAQDEELILRPRHNSNESPQNFAMEVRIGPYKPQIDNEASLKGATPWADTFRDFSRVLVALEFDWQAIRIPYVGTLGPGVSIGYTTMSARARKLGSDQLSGDTTSLDVFPMYAVAVLRADVLMRQAGIPFVPYGKAGIGYVPWRTYTAGGTSSVTNSDGTTVAGKGQTWGWHFALGLSFQLDIIDSYAAKSMDTSVGINHTYLFGEWMFANYNGIGQEHPLLVGTSTWVTGLAFEF